MRTIEIKAYKFSELSEEAKNKAVENFGGDDCEYIFNKAYDSFKAFASIFGVDYWQISFLEPHRNEYNFSFPDYVIDLTGWRLATYIRNNFGFAIFKGKYYGKLVYDVPKSKEHPIGARHVKRYSRVFENRSCVLTGVCYDDNLLSPIYNFLDNPNNNDDIESILNECIELLCKDVQSEYEAMNSFEGISDTIEANEYEFTEDGEMI